MFSNCIKIVLLLFVLTCGFIAKGQDQMSLWDVGFSKDGITTYYQIDDENGVAVLRLKITNSRKYAVQLSWDEVLGFGKNNTICLINDEFTKLTIQPTLENNQSIEDAIKWLLFEDDENPLDQFVDILHLAFKNVQIKVEDA